MLEIWFQLYSSVIYPWGRYLPAGHAFDQQVKFAQMPPFKWSWRMILSSGLSFEIAHLQIVSSTRFC